MDGIVDALKAVPPGMLSFLQEAFGPYSGALSFALSSPLALTTTVMVVATFSCWIGNISSGYWSWVDRLWSTIPVVYAGIYAAWPFFAGGAVNLRITVMALLVAAWGARLTRNFARKGGYSHAEDYRWPVLRAKFKEIDPYHPFVQEVFNLTFVAIYQMTLIWGFVVPSLELVSRTPAGQEAANPFGVKDAVLAIVFLVLLAGEFWADETQWSFQSAKYAVPEERRAKAGGDIANGFCTTGPFAYSRHLNFFCEMSMWWVFYLFTYTAGHPAINWSVCGTFLLTLLFQGSTQMTEALTLGKYPRYAEYQKTTSRLIPWFPGASINGSSSSSRAAAAPASSSDAAPASSAKAAPSSARKRAGSSR
jgi:steroid 5-alpha reductase family enzyme